MNCKKKGSRFNNQKSRVPESGLSYIGRSSNCFEAVFVHDKKVFILTYQNTL